jgi:UDP-N-acetylglucosamine transferase subunit ALG13
MSGDPPYRIFATVGTDHHPFDRLVEWLDHWLDLDTPRRKVEAVVQAGTSRPPRHAESATFLPFDEFRSALAHADTVVCHGGPATLVEAQLAGHLPLVVVRRPEFGEVVDDHQARFATHLADREEIVLIDNYESLAAALDSRLDERSPPRTPRPAARRPEAIDRFAELVDPLIRARERQP